jgi:PAB1-binding protein PBP1
MTGASRLQCRIVQRRAEECRAAARKEARNDEDKDERETARVCSATMACGWIAWVCEY